MGVDALVDSIQMGRTTQYARRNTHDARRIRLAGKNAGMGLLFLILQKYDCTYFHDK
jgi:hypothetical protein